MTKQAIIDAAKSFCSSAKLTLDTDWSQDAHNALVRTIMRDTLKLSPAQIKQLRDAQASLGSLTANASAFRQMLASKDVAVLKPGEKASQLSDRYGV